MSLTTKRVLIENNLWQQIKAPYDSYLFIILNGVEDLTINHNTADNDTSILFASGTPAQLHFIFTNNIVRHGAYLIIGDGVG